MRHHSFHSCLPRGLRRHLEIRPWGLFALGLAFSAHPLPAAPVSAEVGFGVQGFFGADLVQNNLAQQIQGIDGINIVTASWGSLGSPLSAHDSVAASDGQTDSLQVYGNADASWAANGDSGAVSLDYGYSIVSSSSVISQIGTARATDVPNWSYTFVADADGLFVLNYDVSGQGWQLGSRVFDILLNEGYSITNPFHAGSIYDVSQPNLSSFSDTGQFTAAVIAGRAYTVQLVNSFGIAGGITTGSAEITGNFNWSLPGGVRTVPEGGSGLALLAGGLASVAAGATLRARRQASFS